MSSTSTASSSATTPRSSGWTSRPSELGDLEAWFVPGTGSTWIVGVHGVGSERPEFLRLLNEISDLDYPMLMVTYRNDADAPSTDGSLVLFGQDEWRDVQAAVDYALAKDARAVLARLG